MEEHARRTYSAKVFELSRHPRHLGPIKNPNAFGIFKGICGDTMKIYLQIEKGTVKDSGFETDGCEVTLACGTELTEMAIGRKVSEVMSISSGQLLNNLDGLPESHVHCTILAVTSLYCALSNYLFLKEGNRPE